MNHCIFNIFLNPVRSLAIYSKSKKKTFKLCFLILTFNSSQYLEIDAQHKLNQPLS